MGRTERITYCTYWQPRQLGRQCTSTGSKQLTTKHKRESPGLEVKARILEGEPIEGICPSEWKITAETSGNENPR
ncbi:hypothetical protein JTB14_003523 [Gonioctena quinquepunctata]|nr:hypothetical protein JTB14_003523 [Gonioctena quinquepunctata]